MPRIQMSIKPTYTLTPNQKKKLLEKQAFEAEVTEKSGKKPTVFIFMGIGVVLIAAIAGIVFGMSDGKAIDSTNVSVFADNSATSNTDNISNVEMKAKSDTKPVEDEVKDVLKSTPKHDDVVKTENKIISIDTNTKFAQNFYQKVSLIQPGIPQTLKREMLNSWALKVAKISMSWRDFSENAKENARWGISRKAAELADDWGYLAEVFSKNVTPDDREYLSDIVADIIKREAILKKQCSN